jgi:hypothetical protein
VRSVVVVVVVVVPKPFTGGGGGCVSHDYIASVPLFGMLCMI